MCVISADRRHGCLRGTLSEATGVFSLRQDACGSTLGTKVAGGVAFDAVVWEISVYNNMSSGMRDEVEYRLETMGRRAVSQVHQAQQRIVLIAQEMTEEGILNFGSMETFV